MHRRFLSFVSLAAAISTTAWFLVLFQLDPCLTPDENGCAVISPLSTALFFISLFAALTAVFSLLGYILRRNLQAEFSFDQIKISLRQGLLLSFLSCGSLGFLIFGVLTWWSGLLFLAFIVLLEFYLGR